MVPWLQYKTGSVKTLKSSSKKTLTAGCWKQMPPVASEKVAPMLKKFKPDEEVLLCMSQMTAFKWVAVKKKVNDDGSREAVILKRSLTRIEELTGDLII